MDHLQLTSSIATIVLPAVAILDLKLKPNAKNCAMVVT
jgi:hypothetical protein